MNHRLIPRLIVASLPLLALAVVPTLRAQARSADPNTGYAPALFAELEYRMIGPTRGGRVTAVAGVASQPNVFYFGATGGGVWKSDDYGNSWQPISDGFFETGSIGAIRVADSDPNIIYVATGSDGIRSNVIQGKGVYKSTDAGKTWTHVGLRNVGQTGAVLIHPRDPNLVFVAAMGNAFKPTPDRGVYRTRDGGKTWEKVLFVSDSTGAVDLEFAPDSPNEIYASLWRAQRTPWTIISGAREGGIYKSSDGGTTWSRLTTGLPGGLIGKSDLAVSPAAPDRVYALIEAPEPEDGLYRSDDRGRTWTQVSSYNPILNRPFYYTAVDADPKNPDLVFASNEGFYKSTDAGKNWTRASTPHGDNHDLWINPNHTNIWIQSNDGGANVTLDGGRSWSTQLNQPTAELYQVDVDDQFPYWLYAGQQDNTTIGVPSLPPFSHPAGPMGFWRAIGGCETGPAVPKPGSPDIFYSNCKGTFGRYSKATGQEKNYYIGAQNIYGHNPKDLKFRFQRVAPIEVSPHDPNTVYMGSQFVHRTRDDGVTWAIISPDLTANKPQFQVESGTPITRDITGEEHYQVIYDIEESPLERGVIWTGANDGPVYVTRDDGRTWTNVTPPMPPDGRVQNIDVSPHRPGKAYIAAYRYLLGDDQPYLFRTTDYGRTWTRLTTGTNGVPADHPTRVVREDPRREGLLYAGTQYGMYISFDDGARWQPFQQNLPGTPVTDIQVARNDLAVATMGRSFWIMDNVTPLHQLNPQVASAAAHLFQPRDAYRMRYGGGGRGGSDTDPQYARPGAMLDYYLAQAAPGEVKLEILGPSGTVIRTFSGTGAGRRETREQAMRAEFAARSGEPRLEPGAGMHRFTWDLAYPGPLDASSGQPGGRGPLAAPGRYQARLTAGQWTATRAFNLLIDPRVEKDGVTLAALEEQLQHSLRVRDGVSEARQTLQRVRDAKKGLATEGSDQRRRLDALEAQLANASAGGIRYPQPMLVSQFEYLYNMITAADQKLGRDAFERYDELKKQLDGIKQQLSTLVEDRSTP